MNRRNFLTHGTAALAAGAVFLKDNAARAADVPGVDRPREGSAADTGGTHAEPRVYPPGVEGQDYRPVVVPNGTKLPFKIVDGVKVGHLVAEEVDHEFAPGLRAKCWGWNGCVHGPTIEVVDGDRVRFYVTNRLPAPTTVHWHGILLPNGMDGVGGLNQKAIQPGETFLYEFTLRQAGMGMYHSHHDEMTQIGLGMTGLFIVHPRPGKARAAGEEEPPPVDRDFAIMLHEWRLDPGTSRPNPNEMTEFNLLTMNARVYPGTAPLVAKKGERVRIRIGNLSPMDHHPIHLHGYQFLVTETGAGRLPKVAQVPETTVLVPVGSTRTIEFVADEPGDWAFHCHMTHHVMNQMGHGTPNMIGVQAGRFDAKVRRDLRLPSFMSMGQAGMADMGAMGMKVPPNSLPMVGGEGPLGYITMGGMFTILKVREELPGGPGVDPGWYRHPAGTLASLARPEDLARDGVDPRAGGAAFAHLPAKTPDARAGRGVAAAAGAGELFTCVMHPEVVQDRPGNCPKCSMKLVPKK